MEYSEACSEVWYLLSSLKQEELAKIPKKLLETIQILKNDDYNSKIDLDRPLEEQELSEPAIGLIAYIYNNYLGTKEEKEKYEKSYKQYMNIAKNDNSYEFDFKVKNKENINSIPTEVSVYSNKSNIFLRLINKIKRIFNRS